MDKVGLQNHIEANLPDRFKIMKQFRIPVEYNGLLYWANNKNGEWNFEQAAGDVQPIISYNDGSDTVEEKASASKSQRPIKERPQKPVKERPSKPVKEKPVREKPVREKPVKEKPVKERPVKEKKVKERPQSVSVDFDYSDGVPSFVNTKAPIKKLTGRKVFHIILLILSLGTALFVSVPVIYNTSKANANLDNPVEYWHYRKMSNYLHWMTVISLIFAIISVISAILMAGSIAAIISMLLGGA